MQYDLVYGDFKDLERRTQSDKVLRDKAFNIAKDPKNDGYERRLAWMFCIFFDKLLIFLVICLGCFFKKWKVCNNC